GSRELMELFLRRTEVDEDDLTAGVEDDVLGLHVPVDYVPRVEVRQRFEELHDVSSRRRRIGWLVLVQLRQRLAFELFLHETARSEVAADIQISDDTWMGRRAKREQDHGLGPEL